MPMSTVHPMPFPPTRVASWSAGVSVTWGRNPGTPDSSQACRLQVQTSAALEPCNGTEEWEHPRRRRSLTPQCRRTRRRRASIRARAGGLRIHLGTEGPRVWTETGRGRRRLTRARSSAGLPNQRQDDSPAATGDCRSGWAWRPCMRRAASLTDFAPAFRVRQIRSSRRASVAATSTKRPRRGCHRPGPGAERTDLPMHDQPNRQDIADELDQIEPSCSICSSTPRPPACGQNATSRRRSAATCAQRTRS